MREDLYFKNEEVKYIFYLVALEEKIQMDFWKKYQEAETEKDKDIQIIIKELKELKKDKKIRERALRKYYYNSLRELGINPIFGYTKKMKKIMRYTRYIEAV